MTGISNRITQATICLALLLGLGCTSMAEKQAILDAIGHDMRTEMEIELTMQEASEDEREQAYVQRLAQTPLDGCPEDFQEAFRRHIAAWQARDDAAIDSSWDEVVRLAEGYGITFNEG